MWLRLSGGVTLEGFATFHSSLIANIICKTWDGYNRVPFETPSGVLRIITYFSWLHTRREGRCVPFCTSRNASFYICVCGAHDHHCESEGYSKAIFPKWSQILLIHLKRVRPFVATKQTIKSASGSTLLRACSIWAPNSHAVVWLVLYQGHHIAQVGRFETSPPRMERWAP